MRKYILVVCLFLTSSTFANTFERNCLLCHNNMQLKMIMSKYTLKYSSQKRIEEAMFYFLKNPLRKNSVMHLGFINKFGIKEKSKLKDKELKKGITEYYKRYNFTRLIE